jgi:hypothetical protein
MKELPRVATGLEDAHAGRDDSARRSRAPSSGAATKTWERRRMLDRGLRSGRALDASMAATAFAASNPMLVHFSPS